MLTTTDPRADESAQPAPTNRKCFIPPDEHWSRPEKFVWNRVCLGEDADFNVAEGYGGNLDPRTPKRWTQNRLLRSSFIETILLRNQYRRVLTRRGLRIAGARFIEKLDLPNAEIRHELRLERSRLENGADLSGVKSSQSIFFDGSKVTHKLNLDRLQVGGTLSMKHAHLTEVSLEGAHIGSSLSLYDSTITDVLQMRGIQVDQDLFMRKAKFKSVGLIGARVGRELTLHGATVFCTLDAELIEVGLGIYLTEGAEFIGRVDLDFAKTAILELSSAIFHSDVDATGAQISGELRLATSFRTAPPWWSKNSTLVLRNVRTDAIQDSRDAWPAKLDLNGFTYRTLGGLLPLESDSMADRTLEWFKDWLGRQKYAPAPYEQLATVLRSQGRADTASDILYASREGEREVAAPLRYMWLSAINGIIGYGYHIEWAIFWVLGFLAAGIAVLWFSGEGRRNGMPYGIVYSFDMLLPIIRLREWHYSFDLHGWARYYFYVHKAAGHVLALFLGAGLSGLTK